MNRIEIKFNGRLILGVSAEIERPKNDKELSELLQELKDFVLDEGETVEDKELF